MWTKFCGFKLDYSFEINQEPEKIINKKFPDYYFLGGYCPVHNCEITYNKDLINEADLVVTHMVESELKREELPKKIPENQRWVFMLFESPAHSPDFSPYNGFYNLSATHRESGDFPGYSAFANGMIWKRNVDFNNNYDFLNNKSHEVAAIISNCNDNSGRLKYIAELKKYIKVDIYGKCGKNCPDLHNDDTGKSCKQVISKEYKFYLSFENSLCTDYITEKFHDILMNNIIPVVMGEGPYDKYVKKN